MGWLEPQYTVCFGHEAGVAEYLGVEVRAVELSVDLENLDEAESDLLLDVIDEHDEVLTLLGVGSLYGGDGDYGAVIFHDQSR